MTWNDIWAKIPAEFVYIAMDGDDNTWWGYKAEPTLADTKVWRCVGQAFFVKKALSDSEDMWLRKVSKTTDYATSLMERHSLSFNSIFEL